MTYDRRLSSIEDLLHTHQTTTSNILDRLKNVEVAVSNSSRSQASADVVTQLQRELASTKQRLEVVERSYKMDVQRLQDLLYAQQHEHGLAAHQKNSQASHELHELRQNIAEVVKDMRKVDEAINTEVRSSHQKENDLKYVVENLNNQLSGQKEQLLGYKSKIEGVLKMVSMEVHEREALASSIKNAFEASLQGLDDHTVKRIEGEINKRVQLTNDVVVAFKKLRDEVAEGFQRTADSQREVEKALRAVESILKAEIRSRIQSTEVQKRQISSLEQRTANDARVLVEGLKELDQTLNETRNAISTEYKDSLEQLANRVHDLQESLSLTNDVVQSLQETTPKEMVGLSDNQLSLMRQEIKKELTGKGKGDKVSDTKIAEIQHSVDSARASTGVLEREFREALETAAEERQEIVAQLKKGLEFERQQWEAVVMKMQEEASKKAKNDKELFKQLRLDVRSLQRGDTSPPDSGLKKVSGSLEADLVALTDVVTELEIKLAAACADNAVEKLEERKNITLVKEGSDTSMRLKALEKKVETERQEGTELQALKEGLKEERAMREDADNLLNNAVDELLRVYETFETSDYQAQIDELRGNMLACMSAGDERYREITKLFEDQVKGCMKAHAVHERINKKQDAELAEVSHQLREHEIILKDLNR
eukprot:TRINITY_DN10592_c0_g1_i4.p1 TRINITY_DN10592_c0_g1~~TRINITY_DN10592_c0_g1_i4.p1  ORF type:complete len:656 (+),score=227.66 TRINITY_DN10592_c0_g1_i4:70-2037(+)